MGMHIPQPEKLYTVRPRSMLTSSQYGSSRGETCFIRLVGKNTSEFDPQGDPAARGYASLQDDQGFAPFLMQNLQVNFSEKVQILPTFGDMSTAYYFGNSPVVFNCSGISVDDVDNVHFIDFLSTYAEVMRGTRLAQAYCLVELFTPTMRIIGSFMSLDVSQSSDRDTDVRFNFQFLAKLVIPVEPLDNGAPIDPTDYTYGLSENYWESVASDTQTFYNQARILNIQQSVRASINTGWGMDGSGIGSGKSASGGAWAAGIEKFTSEATAFVASIFKPVYGLLSSVLDFLNNITNAVMDVVKGFTGAIKKVLRTVRNFSNQINKVVKQIQSFNLIGQIKAELNSVQSEYKKTVSSLKNTVGSISSLPKNMAENMRNQFQSGGLRSSRLTAGSSTSSYKFKMSVLKQKVNVNGNLIGGGSITPLMPSYSLDSLPPRATGRGSNVLSVSTSRTRT